MGKADDSVGGVLACFEQSFQFVLMPHFGFGALIGPCVYAERFQFLEEALTRYGSRTFLDNQSSPLGAVEQGVVFLDGFQEFGQLLNLAGRLKAKPLGHRLVLKRTLFMPERFKLSRQRVGIGHRAETGTG